MTQYTEIELHIFSDTEGNCEADVDKDVAAERFTDNVGTPSEHYRVLLIRIPQVKPVTVTLPELPDTVIEAEG